MHNGDFTTGTPIFYPNYYTFSHLSSDIAQWFYSMGAHDMAMQSHEQQRAFCLQTLQSLRAEPTSLERQADLKVIVAQLSELPTDWINAAEAYIAIQNHLNAAYCFRHLASLTPLAEYWEKAAMSYLATNNQAEAGLCLYNAAHTEQDETKKIDFLRRAVENYHHAGLMMEAAFAHEQVTYLTKSLEDCKRAIELFSKLKSIVQVRYWLGVSSCIEKDKQFNFMELNCEAMATDFRLAAMNFISESNFLEAARQFHAAAHYSEKLEDWENSARYYRESGSIYESLLCYERLIYLTDDVQKKSQYCLYAAQTLRMLKSPEFIQHALSYLTKASELVPEKTRDLLQESATCFEELGLYHYQAHYLAMIANDFCSESKNEWVAAALVFQQCNEYLYAANCYEQSIDYTHMETIEQQQRFANAEDLYNSIGQKKPIHHMYKKLFDQTTRSTDFRRCAAYWALNKKPANAHLCFLKSIECAAETDKNLAMDYLHLAFYENASGDRRATRHAIDRSTRLFAATDLIPEYLTLCEQLARTFLESAKQAADPDVAKEFYLMTGQCMIFCQKFMCATESSILKLCHDAAVAARNWQTAYGLMRNKAERTGLLLDWITAAEYAKRSENKEAAEFCCQRILVLHQQNLAKQQQEKPEYYEKLANMLQTVMGDSPSVRDLYYQAAQAWRGKFQPSHLPQNAEQHHEYLRKAAGLFLKSGRQGDYREACLTLAGLLNNIARRRDDAASWRETALYWERAGEYYDARICWDKARNRSQSVYYYDTLHLSVSNAGYGKVIGRVRELYNEAIDQSRALGDSDQVKAQHFEYAAKEFSKVAEKAGESHEKALLYTLAAGCFYRSYELMASDESLANGTECLNLLAALIESQNYQYYCVISRELTLVKSICKQAGAESVLVAFHRRLAKHLENLREKDAIEAAAKLLQTVFLLGREPQDLRRSAELFAEIGQLSQAVFRMQELAKFTQSREDWFKLAEYLHKTPKLLRITEPTYIYESAPLSLQIELGRLHADPYLWSYIAKKAHKLGEPRLAGEAYREEARCLLAVQERRKNGDVAKCLRLAFEYSQDPQDARDCVTEHSRLGDHQSAACMAQELAQRTMRDEDWNLVAGCVERVPCFFKSRPDFYGKLPLERQFDMGRRHQDPHLWSDIAKNAKAQDKLELAAEAFHEEANCLRGLRARCANGDIAVCLEQAYLLTKNLSYGRECAIEFDKLGNYKRSAEVMSDVAKISGDGRDWLIAVNYGKKARHFSLECVTYYNQAIMCFEEKQKMASNPQHQQQYREEVNACIVARDAINARRSAQSMFHNRKRPYAADSMLNSETIDNAKRVRSGA